MSLAYKVEELLALRDSVSESAVSIDKFADEDAVKAERLLKEHGSPPGIRVTAGGRIVPSDLPPLGVARFGTTGFRLPTLRGIAPSTTMSSQSSSDVNNANNVNNINNVPTQTVEVINGQAVLKIGDRLYALPAINPSPVLPPTMPSLLGAPALSNEPSMLSVQSGYQTMALPLQNNGSQTSLSQPSIPGGSVAELRNRQATKKQELRTVEQTEVLQASHQTEEWRAGIIQKKKSLILELDNLRKQISIVEGNASIGGSTSAPSIGLPTGNGTTPTFQPAFVPQYQQPVAPPLFTNVGPTGSMPPANQYNPLMMYPPYIGSDVLPADGKKPINGTQYPNGLSATTKPPLSPGSASRRSHAIEIKPPRDDKKKAPAHGSSLDPKSPTYQPGMKINASLPHSSTRIAPSKLMPSKQPSRESMILPSTPDKSWPAGPWNPQPNSGSKMQQINQGDSARKFTSWTEEFRGKPLDLSTTSSYLPRSDSKAMAEYEAAVASSRRISAQQSGSTADQSWRLMTTQPVSHMPSTYQEGFQAGFEHVGLPRNPEVLRGFIEGLQLYLRESNAAPNVTTASINSRGSSRGQLTSGTLHDSAISMAFPRGEPTIAKNENVRSATVGNGHSPGSRRVTYGTPGIVLEPAAKIGNENAHDVRARHFPIGKDKGLSDALNKYVYSYQRADATSADNDTLKHQAARQAQADAALQALGFPRQYSGNASGRLSSSPTGMQRYYPTAKTPGASGHDSSSSKPVTRQQVSNMDGAMDDLAGLMVDSSLEDTHHTADNAPTTSAAPAAPSADNAEAETGASCFRSSSSKGKAKAPASPTKSTSGIGKETAASSPTKPSGSPKKSGEHSPAKAKLESVTNKLRRSRKDDPRNLSPEDKQRRAQKWHRRFQIIKQNETKEIEEHVRNNPRNESGGGSAYR
ncbi:hypothetical protein BDV96DRAFT_609778 [Lophiotrema nucula]|uniref:Uncharacterized protein n=1 Tax=Lophiotrema nucula TaxID=690887 RepID=A0A6A5ZN22_9PLEO|nr:hypothetical protein BDV96DRAFT_609778 [Lophiotrema nucula]